MFATGTMRWVCAMKGKACRHGVTDEAPRFVSTVTGTLIRAMANGPLARAHPARPNYKNFEKSADGQTASREGP